MKGFFRLSPSSLNIFLECPRCFWLQIMEGVKRPSGPFPSLPGGMDAVIKVYFDKCRDEGRLPVELEGKVLGKLFADKELLSRWRNWREGIIFNDSDAVLFGALDDCLVEESSDGDLFIPLDYKTRGWPRKEDSHSYYQNQLDTYTLLLQKNGLKTKDIAYLVFYHPLEHREGGLVRFQIEPVEVKTDPEHAYKVFRDAVSLLQQSKPPASHSDCEFCGYVEHQGETN